MLVRTSAHSLRCHNCGVLLDDNAVTRAAGAINGSKAKDQSRGDAAYYSTLGKRGVEARRRKKGGAK